MRDNASCGLSYACSMRPSSSLCDWFRRLFTLPAKSQHPSHSYHVGKQSTHKRATSNDRCLGQQHIPTQWQMHVCQSPSQRHFITTVPRPDKNSSGRQRTWAFTQSARKLPEFAELMQNNAITPFKVTDFGTNRKLIYDFLLVINSNLPPILHRFRDTAVDKSEIAIVGYPSCV